MIYDGLYYIILCLICAIVFCFVEWTAEILYIIHIIKIYFYITMISVIWALHFGSKSFRLTYKNPNDEEGVHRVINFPAIWW